MSADTSTRLIQEQRLQQRLVPQQVQFVKMLEMSGPEIEDEVNREIDDNPALEKVDEELPVQQDQPNEIPYYRLYATNRSADDDSYEPITPDTPETLREHLLRQLSELSLDDNRTALTRYIIGNIDNNGYLTRDKYQLVNDIAVNENIETTPDQITLALETIHAMDPPGIGAIDLRECLLLQLRRTHGDKPTIATEIIADYFDLFSKKHFDHLRAELGISRQELADAIDEIRALNPRPGNAFESGASTQPLHTIIPDFGVEVDGDTVNVTLFNSVPELRIEESFNIDTSDSTPHDHEAFAFIKQKHDDAASFIRLLRMRQETLLKVMKAIVSLQRDFFTNQDDESLIHPMILRDVASLTGLDLSVISRATMGKWVSTPYGVYPLKKFFNERVRDNEDTSSHEIMAALRLLIDNEDKTHPLSDDILTAQLNKKGYTLARRTVAKYRERLNIPVARLRREI